jgi:bifunctional non-homologous end joining protein LigD
MLASGPPDPIVPPSGAQWSFEVKWDGVRALACVRADGPLRLRSRRGTELSAHYPAIVDDRVGGGLAALVAPAILDGECVAFIGGRPSFPGALRGGGTVRFMCFDVLAWQGRDVCALPLEERRALLAGIDLAHVTGDAWLRSPVFADGPALMAATDEQGLEGVVAKRSGSPYRPGVRSDDWVKLPHLRTTSLVVVGWVRPRSGTGVGSLVVADSRRTLVGSVGSGMTERISSALLPVLGDIGRGEPDPGLVIAPARTAWLRSFGDRLRWVEPALVVDVRHLGRTEGGGLRHPVLERLRPDLGPAGVLEGPQ